MRRLLSILSLLLLGASAAGQSELLLRHVLVGVDRATYLFEVSAAGRVTRLPYEFTQNAYGSVGLGGSGPVLSPNDRWVAFTRDDDLFLLELSTGEEVAITDMRDERSDTLACQSFITQWSLDSRRLLYCVAHRRIWGDHIDLSPLTAFFTYTLENRDSTPVTITGVFECWLDNGDFVVSGQDGKNWNSLTRVAELVDPSSSGEKDGEVLLPDACSPNQTICYGQITPSPDGSRLAMLYSRVPNTTRIVQLDLKTHAITPISPLGAGAQFQLPSFSPSGRRVAYLETDAAPNPTRGGKVRHAVWVDDRPAFSRREMPSGGCQYSWVSDTALVVVCDDSLHVVDVETGVSISHPVRAAEAPDSRSSPRPARDVDR